MSVLARYVSGLYDAFLFHIFKTRLKGFGIKDTGINYNCEIKFCKNAGFSYGDMIRWIKVLLISNILYGNCRV